MVRSRMVACCYFGVCFCDGCTWMLRLCQAWWRGCSLPIGIGVDCGAAVAEVRWWGGVAVLPVGVGWVGLVWGWFCG